MKIRNGFVSNSSSSSFVLIMTKEAYDTRLAQMDKEAQTIIKKWAQKKKFLGHELVCFSEISNSGGYSNLFSQEVLSLSEETDKYIEEHYDGDISAIYYDFEEKIPAKDRLKLDADI